MKKARFLTILLVGLVLLALVPAALAFEGRGGDRVIVERGEVIDDDLYVGADSFVLDGTVRGDLFVGGTQIIINGVVEGDLFAAGQEIIINGVVEDDVRVAGAVITLGENGRIGDDLLAAGYGLETEAGSLVQGSVLFTGGQALLAGETTRDVHVAAAALEIAGQIGGNVNADVGGDDEIPGFSPMFFIPDMPSVPPVPAGLTVRQGATIGGDLAYSGPEEGTVAGAVGGQTTYERMQDDFATVEGERVTEPSTTAVFGRWVWQTLQNLLALLLVGLVLIWLAPRFTQGTADALEDQPVPSLGFGCLGFILVPLAILVLIGVVIFLAIVLGAITLGGLAGTVLSVGLLVTSAAVILFSLIVIYVTKITVSLLVGQKVLGLVNDEWGAGRVWPLIVGVLLLVLLTAVPLLGPAVNFVVILLGLGALWFWWQRRDDPTAVVVAPPPPPVKPAV